MTVEAIKTESPKYARLARRIASFPTVAGFHKYLFSSITASGDLSPVVSDELSNALFLVASSLQREYFAQVVSMMGLSSHMEISGTACYPALFPRMQLDP